MMVIHKIIGRAETLARADQSAVHDNAVSKNNADKGMPMEGRYCTGTQ
jgi:hypothetical protein